MVERKLTGQLKREAIMKYWSEDIFRRTVRYHEVHLGGLSGF